VAGTLVAAAVPSMPEESAGTLEYERGRGAL